MTGRPIIHEVMLALGVFLASMAVQSVREISTTLEQIRVDLGIVSQKVLELDRRIQTIESRMP